MIQLTPEAIDPSACLAQVADRDAGAVVLFLGTARETTGPRRTDSLDYDAYAPMAEKQLASLEVEARRRWPILECIVAHRLGHLEIGEASVAVAVSAPHREEAFAAARWLIDAIKEKVPIWKKENWTDGTSQWVHPGLDGQATGERGAGKR